MKNFLPLLSLLAASSCGALRSLPVTDSARVEVRVERETVTDTAFIELPLFVERVATLDTASVLENPYSRSEATVSDGILKHSLETKPVSVPVEVKTEIVCRDSLVYRDRVQRVEVEVEKPLSLWQRVKMSVGGVSIVIILIVLTYYIIHLFVQLKIF